jgi:hypothetical protein
VNLTRWRGGLLVAAMLLPSVSAPAKPVFGVVEPILVYLDKGYPVLAKLDTGADRSSLHAEQIETFEREGRSWVRAHTQLDGTNVQMIERPLLRQSRVRRSGAASAPRPVIELEWCIGRQRLRSEFNLVDRGSLSTPVLIGRAELAQLGAVDAARHQTTRPDCGAAPETRSGVE